MIHTSCSCLFFDHLQVILFRAAVRSILIDWLLDVHNKLNFKEETLYMTIYLIDSFLAKKFIERKKFQLLGVASLLIATKFNEIYVRKIADYALLTANTYTINDILNMEKEITKTLNFNFLVPSPLSFFEIISKKIGIYGDINKYKFGEFLMQSFLLDHRSMFYSYSTIASSSCYIVMKFYKMKDYCNCYSTNLYTVKYKKYNNDAYTIKECAKNICEVIGEMINSNLQSAINKYSLYNFYADITNI